MASGLTDMENILLTLVAMYALLRRGELLVAGCAITSSALTRLSCLRAHKHAYALGSSPPQLHDRLTKVLLQALKHR